MSTVEDYDGLCGVIHPCASSDKQVRCSYEFGHHGKHSWAGRYMFRIFGGCLDPYYEEDQFINSVLHSLKK